MSRLVAASLLACCDASAIATEEIPQTALANFERFESLEITGRFPYFTHRFSGIGSPVHICQFDYWKSGGSFLGIIVSNDIPTPAGIAIQDCVYWEWYRRGTTSGETNLVVAGLNAEPDRSENRGHIRERFVIAFEAENGRIRRVDSIASVADLLSDPSLSFLERPQWFTARRSTAGEWSSAAFAGTTEPSYLPAGALVPDDGQLAALRSSCGALQSPTSTNAIRVVFESVEETPPVDAKAAVQDDIFTPVSRPHPCFALVSDGSDATEDGWLWSAFLWNGTEWEEAPTNGFACASGRCPASFRARPDEFYRLSLSGETPRLVVLKNRNGRLRETFWEEALGPKAPLLDWSKGVPDKHYMGVCGFPDAPLSVVQTMSFRFSEFLRLERIVPEILLP